MVRHLVRVYDVFEKWFYTFADFIYVAYLMLKDLPKIRKHLNLVLNNMHIIGFQSYILIFMTAIFTGVITALQASYQFKGLAPDIFLGTAIFKSVVVELGPVMTALILASKITSATTAELGSMAVTEQIDAYYVLNLDPIEFLITPKVIAGVFIVPLLTVLSDYVAIFGAWLTTKFVLGVSTVTFIAGTRKFYSSTDIFTGMMKAAVFGVIITYVGSYFGYRSTNGAVGVGKNTKLAVVTADILILVFDFLVAILLF